MTAIRVIVPVHTQFGGTTNVEVTLAPGASGGVHITADCMGWRRTAEIPAAIAQEMSRAIGLVLLSQKASDPVRVR